MHTGSCLCDECCKLARDFAFDQWGLDRPYRRVSLARPESPMVSRTGRWYGVPGAAEVGWDLGVSLPTGHPFAPVVHDREAA